MTKVMLEEHWEERVYVVTKKVVYDENDEIIKEEVVDEGLKEVTDSGFIRDREINENEKDEK